MITQRCYGGSGHEPEPPLTDDRTLSTEEPPSDLIRRAVAEDSPALANRAIDWLRASPADDPARHATNLGAALTTRYDLTGDAESLREAIAEQRKAVTARPDDPRFRSNLGIALLRLYECTDDVDVLANARDELRRAVGLARSDGRGLAAGLANLGLAMVRLAEHTGTASPAIEAVAVHGEAVAAAGDPARKAAMTANRAAAEMLVFRLTGDQQWLRAAVECYHDAARVVPSGHAYERGCLAGLGEALAAAARLDADVTASVAAVATLQRAVGRLRTRDPDAPLYLSALAEALRCSYVATGDSEALYRSITARRDALTRTLTSHPQRLAYSANLAMALRNRFEALGDTADLREAADLLDKVLTAATDEHAEAPKWRGDRAHVLSRLGAEEQDPALLAEAAALLRTAVKVTPPQHRDGVMHRVNLAGVLVTMIDLRWDENVYENAMAVLAEAEPACSEDTPAWAELQLNLGLAHVSRCRLVPSNRSAYEAGATALRRALNTKTAPPRLRLAAGWYLAALFESGHDFRAALAVYTSAVELLDQVAWRGLHRTDQERALTQYTGLGRAAAACAAGLDDPDGAMTLLERGRGILLGRLLDDRTRHAQLEEREPQLAQELRDALDSVAAAQTDLPVVERQRLELRRAEVLDRIRCRPGFTGFLRTPDADRLRRGVQDGTVVALNVAVSRCDALISTAEQTRIVPLPELNASHCTTRLEALLTAVTSNTWKTNEVLTDTLGWLWDVIVGPVIAALDPSDEPPHVHWLPTGPLSLLPLHAAGHPGAGSRSALDRLVSSYLPAMRPLAERPTTDDRVPGALVVGVDALGSPLPDVAIEAVSTAADMNVPVKSLLGSAATKAKVLTELPLATRLHLAGHAVTDPSRPSESHIVLADGVLPVAEISALRTAGGDLAYLSACETAAGSPGLADEAIHISSAFQLAGFRNVVGTLWQVPDRAAREISSAFYSAHTTHSVSHSLNTASRALRRRYPASPGEWAAFIHCSSLSPHDAPRTDTR